MGHAHSSAGMGVGTAAVAAGAAGLVGGMLLESALENRHHYEYGGFGGGFEGGFGGGFGPFGGERIVETRNEGFFGSEEVITDVRTDMFGDTEVRTEVIDRDIFVHVEDAPITETDFW